MRSIFSPRVNVSKSGVVTLLNNKHHYVFDQYYFDPVVKEKVKKIGDGDSDFIIEKVLSFKKKSIKETIDSQCRNIPDIDTAIKRFADTGDLTVLPPGMEDGEFTDFTKLPQDHAEYMAFLTQCAEEYDALDPELKKGMTLKEFIEKADDKYVSSYLNSIKPKEKDGGKDE